MVVFSVFVVAEALRPCSRAAPLTVSNSARAIPATLRVLPPANLLFSMCMVFLFGRVTTTHLTMLKVKADFKSRAFVRGETGRKEMKIGELARRAGLNSSAIRY